MLLVGSALKGFAIEATDGFIGTARDFLFDDRTWKIRWMVVEAGSWLAGHKVLVHPSAIGRPDYEREHIPVRLAMQQVKDSPGILSDAPVSRQMETDLNGYYGWDPLWGSGNYFAGYSSGMGGAFDPLQRPFDTRLLEEGGSADEASDPHLRSLAAVVGYHIQATDGPIGHVENILVDDQDWGLRYLIVDTRNWLPSRHVLISPFAVRGISWSDRDVSLDVTCAKVKDSPVWDPATAISRDYQQLLHNHYGWPGYGW